MVGSLTEMKLKDHSIQVPIGSVVLSDMVWNAYFAEEDDLLQYLPVQGTQNNFIWLSSADIDNSYFTETFGPLLTNFMTQRYNDIANFLDCEDSRVSQPDLVCTQEKAAIQFIRSPPLHGSLEPNGISGVYADMMTTAMPECLFGSSQTDKDMWQSFGSRATADGTTFDQLRSRALQDTLLAGGPAWISQRDETPFDQFRVPFIGAGNAYPELSKCRSDDKKNLQLFYLVNGIDMKSLMKMISLRIVLWIMDKHELATAIRFDIPFTLKSSPQDKAQVNALEVIAGAPQEIALLRQSKMNYYAAKSAWIEHQTQRIRSLEPAVTSFASAHADV